MADSIADRLRTCRLRKSKAVSNFLQSRYGLLELIDDPEIINPEAVRRARSSMNAAWQAAENCIGELISLYGEADDVDSQQELNRELDKMLSEYSSTMEAAQESLQSDKVSNVSSRRSNTDQQEMIDLPNPAIDENTSQSYPVVSSGDGDVGRDLWRQLKRVSIPVFSGDKKLYENWKASFVACVDQAPSSAEYKLLQLRQYLGGEALKCIENLGHSSASYEAAKQRLDRKFGGARRHIAAQIEEVDEFKAVRPGNARDLDKLADLLDVLVINLKEANRSSELGYGSLYFKLLKKLPEHMIANFQRWVNNNNKPENVESLHAWINQEAEFQMIASETVKGLSPLDTGGKLSGSSRYKREQTLFTQVRAGCACCKEQHGIWKCLKFKSLNVPARWQVAKDQKLCFRCLGNSHVGQSCNRSRVCGLNGCRQVHHRLLHADQENAVTTPRVVSSGHVTSPQHTEEPQPVSSSYSIRSEGGAAATFVPHDSVTTMVVKDVSESYIGLRIVPVILENRGKRLQVNALLDDGSTKTYLNSDVAAELGLVGQPQQVSVSVLNGKYEVFETMPVEVTLHSADGRVSQHVVALTTDKVTGSMKGIDWTKHKDQWPHLRGIQFPRLHSRYTVDMLIGVDYADLHFAKSEIRGRPGEPIARLTPLGWTCVGNVSPQSSVKTHFGVHTYFARDTEALDMSEINLSLRKFWEVEEITPKEVIVSGEDRRVIEQLRSSMVHVDGGYEVNIPWKDRRPSLPNNYEMALQRLNNTEKGLRRRPEVQEAYQKTVSQYVDKGYVHKVNHAAIREDDSMWFLPHFPVVRPEKATTKVRIVFDASAQYKGESLNESINTGPKLQRELFDVLLHFRKHPVALVCDIAEMYLRIKIAETDQRYFRFLWRDMDQNRPPDVYEFSRVVFGVNCSPFVAQFVSQEHAKQSADEFPMAAQTVLESTYMDDCMDSVVDDCQGLELYRQLSELWKRCGMHTRKWLSNSEAVMSRIPFEDRAYEIEIEGDQLHGTKTLGVLWLPRDDVFTFHLKPVEQQFVCTKRNVLKKVAALFDPLGFLAPFIVRAKILLQAMWMRGLDWDELLDTDLKHAVELWLSELSEFKNLQIPRCLCVSNSTLQMHVFADASSEAYGAVVYMRCVDPAGKISTNLVSAKTKVAPLVSCSIPRLELMAAVVALRLGLAAARALKIPHGDLYFWSDSMNVLWWIRNHSRCYKPFVANRVGEIQAASNPDHWRYVPTKLNPADFASRGLSASKLIVEELWWSGPEFLRLDEDLWPQTDIQIQGLSVATSSELRKSTRDRCQSVATLFAHDCMQVTFLDRLKPSRYSSWTQILRVHAWVLRFVNNCRSTSANRNAGELSSDEIRESELLVIRACQQEGFRDEYRALMHQKPLSTNSKILSLNPQLDEDGILRSNSRVVNSDVLPYSARYPVILPRKHDVTRLIVKHEHEQGAHVSGTNHTLSALSQRYWIVSAREVIREWELTCNECRRRKAKGATQIMAPLPRSRLNMPEPLRCFVHTAVDFAGPFTTVQKRGRIRTKRYMCLFTCMSTRAVHIEMAYGLDTDSFMNAFYRFASRRGFPHEVTSDNGTNFVGAQRELKQLIADIDKKRLLSYSTMKGVKWNFNPPAAPHFGGVFEIMIKAAKRAVYAILSNADVNDEELVSAFIGAEALINSRPITYQSANPQDILPLTPSHFLHGDLGGRIAPTPVDEVKHPRHRWRRVQELIRHFWHRWLTEWIPQLRSRKKWKSSSPEIAVGNIVLVIQSDTVRANWPLGKVVAVYTGSDGHVRVADVQINKTVLRRPITALCPLEFSDN